MMGHNGGNQNRLFYSFNLDDHVPANHLLRGIDQFFDLTDLRAYLAPFYSHIGRPSIDPELMIRMLVVGYCFGIRSERRLCEEVHLNLAYRWFCRLGIEDAVPEHSTRRTGMAAFARAMYSGMCLRRYLSDACTRGWWAARVSRSMRASSKQTLLVPVPFPVPQ
jgi:Transposase domain (DUF772)